MKKDSLGDRMKRYEAVYQTKLIPRSYTIIRLDGKAFHTYTKGLMKPFDKELVDDMIETAKYLCRNIQGCKLGYVQSDEISLLLTDFDTHETQPWLGNEIQKILSISASMATGYFNTIRRNRHIGNGNLDGYWKEKIAFFDSRAFQVPNLSEVYNCFLWRQNDAIRNSISACAQALYSHKELNGINQLDMLSMIGDKAEEFSDIMKKAGYCDNSLFINGSPKTWELLPSKLKVGTTIIKQFGEWGEIYPSFNYKFFELNIINNI